MNVRIYKLKAYVENSKHRTNVMNVLSRYEFKKPTQIAKECDIGKSRISKYIVELRNKKLIECINEEMRKGRLYRLTEDGLKVQKLMKGEF